MLRRLGLVLLSLAAALVLVEIGLRVWAHRASRERALAFDPELGWRMLPDARKLGRYWGATRPAQTNSHGFRDRERTHARTPGVLRIVAIGDSFTFGADVDDGERFTDALERAAPGLEALNLGVNAYGPDQELRLLEIEGLRYAPDVVVWVVFLGNDLHDLRYARRFHWPRPYFALAPSSPGGQGGELVLHRPSPSLDVRLRESSYVGEALFQAASGWIVAEELAPEHASPDTLPLFAAIARRMAKDCAEQRARLLVVLAWPPAATAGNSGLADVAAAPGVRAALDAIPIEVLDTREMFAAGLARGEALYGNGGHWTRLGHESLAAAILERLRALAWMPP